MSDTNSQHPEGVARARSAQAQTGEASISEATLARIIEITEQRIATRPNPMGLDTFEQIEAFAERAARSQMVPKDYIGKPDNIIIAVMKGKELGMPPIQALESIAIVNGRSSIWGAMVEALCYASGLVEDHEEHFEGTEGTDDFTAVCTVKRRGVASPKVGRFSQKDAKIAGLFGQAVHGKYPRRMMQWRAKHAPFTDAFPDVLKGLAIREIETEDAVSTPGWTMPVPEKGWFTTKPQARSDGWDDTWFNGVVQKLAGEPNAWKWLDLLIGCLTDAPALRDVQEIGDLPMVMKVRETAPDDAKATIDTAFARARTRLAVKKEPESNAPARQQTAPVADAEHDSAGVAWNERLHASSRARNTDGTWRARRGADKEAASEQRQDEPATGGLFGDEQQNSPAQPRPQSGTASVAATSDEPRPGGGAEASAGRLATAFEQWLVDGEGSEIADADGVIEAFHDPVAFARAYMDALSNEFPGTIELFKAANKEALVAAMIASTEVAPILAGTPLFRSDQSAVGIDPAFVPPPTKNTPAELRSYLDRLKVVAGTWTTDAAITHGVTLNAPTYEAADFPAPSRMKAKGIIADRREAVKPAAVRGAAEPTLNDLAERMAEDLASFDKATDIEAWKSFGKITTELARLKDGAPDLYDRVMRFAEQRRLELNAEELIKKIKATTTMAELDAINKDKWCIAALTEIHTKDPEGLRRQVQSAALAHKTSLEASQTTTG